MNKNSNTYIIIYATVLVVVVAAVLAYASISLSPRQQANIEVEKMGAILSSIGQGKDADQAADKSAYIKEQYAKYITSAFCVDAQGNRVEGGNAFRALDDLPEVFSLKEAMPVFEAKLNNGERLIVVPTMGKGLWGPVWGYIALNADCNTVYGAVFDHKGETPGLGAEISTAAFGDQLVGKELFAEGKFKSITLTKGVGSSEGNPHAIDAISGGTLTSNGVSAMLRDCLGDYAPYFEKARAENSAALNSAPIEQPTDTLTIKSYND